MNTPLLSNQEKVSILKIIKDKTLHDKMVIVLCEFNKLRENNQKLIELQRKKNYDILRDIAEELEGNEYNN